MLFYALKTSCIAKLVNEDVSTLNSTLFALLQIEMIYHKPYENYTISLKSERNIKKKCASPKIMPAKSAYKLGIYNNFVLQVQLGDTHTPTPTPVL